MRVGLDWNQIFRKDTVATISSTVYVCKQKQMKYKVCIKVSDDEDTVMNNNNVMVTIIMSCSSYIFCATENELINN